MSGSQVSLDGVNAEQLARAIGICLKDAATAQVTNEELLREGERLRRTLLQSPVTSHKRHLTRWVMAAALAATVALAIGWAIIERRADPLTVTALAGSLRRAVASQYVAAPEGQPLRLEFSDGSSVTVFSGARLRIEELTRVGATLLVEKGSTHVRVRHRDRTTGWKVLAGPFAIAVTGTEFTVNWDAATERLVVELREGRVEIDGPKFAAPATLKSGQRFEATTREARWSVTPVTEDMAVALANQQKAVASVGASELEVVGSDSRRPQPQATGNAGGSSSGKRRSVPEAVPEPVQENGRQWPRLVASGEFRQVTREADAMGLMVCLSNCSAADLRALADAARYTGRFDTAEAALRVLYDKYPAQANTAAYLLGVVDEARGKNASALRWYEDYLSRGSNGAFVPEVRAARLRMLVATAGNAGAREAARDYLQQYPSGSAASLATKVLEGR